MSTGMLCEFLGPAWITTAAERDAIYKELEKRGEDCSTGSPAARAGTASTTNEPPIASAPDGCSLIDGASLIADDDTYIGKLANKYNSDSIYNQYGTYGSEYSSESIWNEYSSYGSEYSSSSPWNEYSSSGPLIVKDDQIIGRLTINQYVQGAVNPTVVGTLCFDSDRGNPN